MAKARRYVFFGSVLAFAVVFALVESEPRMAAAVQTAAPRATDAERVARDPRVPPRRRRRLFTWLRASSYKELYVPEPNVHDSLGPHGGNVRTYYNPILVEDLRGGRDVWSKGAAMVKELYFGGSDNVLGYAVMIKVDEETGADGEGWLFYETFDTTGGSGTYGRGVGLCVNCHRAGADFLLSAFRPE